MADRQRDLLIELGTEELPPTALAKLAAAFEAGILEGLDKQQLQHGECRTFATPRRLAVLVRQVALVQPDRNIQRRGPAVKAAFKDGRPTPAAEGFARSCGVTVEQLETLETDKGAWLIHTQSEPGTPTPDLLPDIIIGALDQLPIPKRMRWGAGSEQFVRPVRWLVLLLGDEVVDASVLAVTSGRESRGHRFHHPAPISIPEPLAYPQLLRDQGKVVVDLAERRRIIEEQTRAKAQQLGGRPVIDPDLLDEVAALVEWPVALAGSFDQRFLNVPAEALITTMQDNQKYFPVVDGEGKLLPYFIFISNIDSHDPRQVIAGNERVIRPRFADAEFFWNQDRRHPLASRLESLRSVIFQQRLGSLHDKSERVAALARVIAADSGGQPDWAERAAWLAKCDLITDMVQEFPELQGIMGRYYARHDGESDEVAQALDEQYQPRFAGDSLPATATGRAVALADRLDTLVGIFAIGQAPSGAKDPFALRRAALGVLRILIEHHMELDLESLLERAGRHFPAEIKAATVVEAVFDFIMERLKGYYQEKGFRPDELDAVQACRPVRPVDFDRRLRAVAEFRKLPAAESLAAANKRIRNILKKVEGTWPFSVDTALLQEEEEQVLAGRLAELSSEVIPLMEKGLYDTALSRLASLREPVDAFFDKVMVMAEDEALRNNRIALLNELESLFLRIADFSRLQGN